MKRGLFLLFFMIIALPSLAEEEIPVNIKADHLKYVEETGLVTASGSVEIEIEGNLILADQLVMDTNTNIVTCEGNVWMKSADYKASCSYIRYNVSDETSVFHDFKTETRPENIKGSLFLYGQELYDKKGSMESVQGTVTTCDYSHPHYFVHAHKIEYYPGDAIVGYFVTFYQSWLGTTPVFWSPYIYYDLKRKRERNWVIGRNDVEGDFIKTSWDLPNGVLYLDQMEKKGFGTGLLQDYDLKRSGRGNFYVYHLNESDTGLTDWVFKLNHNLGLSKTARLSLSHSSSFIYLVPYGRLDQSAYNIDYSHQGDNRFNFKLDALDNRYGGQEKMVLSTSNIYERYETSYSASLDQGKVDPRSIRLGQRLSHRQPFLNDQTNISFNANYMDSINQVGLPGDERLEPNLEINHQGPFYRLKFYENWYLDLDRDLYTGDEADQYLEKQPEVTLTFDPYDLTLFSLQPELGAGWYHEVKYVAPLRGNRDFSSSRVRGTLNANRSIPLRLGSTLYLSAGVDQILYEPGDQLYALREDFSLNTRLFNFIKNDLTYKRGYSEGNTPFFFDRLGTRYSYYKETLTLYYRDYVNWQTSGGFNFEVDKYFNLETTLDLRPSNRLNLKWRTGYDIENQNYLDLVTGVRLLPLDSFSFELSLVNDLNLGKLKRGNSVLDWEIGSEDEWQGHWEVKLGHVYDPVRDEFKLRDVMLVKDLHCWEVKYTYSDFLKQFSITFTLKAMPEEPLGYTKGRGFYFEGFENTLKEEVKGASPQRY